MFKNADEQIAYIEQNFTEVTDRRITAKHWDFECPHCKVVRGFNVITHHFVQTRYFGKDGPELELPNIYLFRCPVCQAMLQWIVYELEDALEQKRYFRAMAVPAVGSHEISELPADPPELRTAYRQAYRAMDANAPLAAAAMFRRALQVITRKIFGVKPGNLATELREIVGRQLNSVTISHDFSNVAYLVKEAGNQGAHPDEDVDLLDFTEQDALELQGIFLDLVSEIFVVPEAARKSREAFAARRKIVIPQTVKKPKE